MRSRVVVMQVGGNEQSHDNLIACGYSARGSCAKEAMSPLVVENAAKQFRQGDRVVNALAGVSLEVAPGSFVAIMGASGSGKSTLLHLMAGLTRPSGGRVLVNGTDIGALNDRQLTLFRRRQIGLVFQSFKIGRAHV